MINDESASFEEEGYLLLNLKYLRAVLDVEGDASGFETQATKKIIDNSSHLNEYECMNNETYARTLPL